MKTIFFAFLVLTMAIVSCAKEQVEKAVPDCIKSKIEDFSKSEACEQTATVKEYTFQSQTVYVFDPGTCGADMASNVVDSQCNTLGMLNGYAGNTKINGEDFSHATFIRTIWKN